MKIQGLVLGAFLLASSSAWASGASQFQGLGTPFPSAKNVSLSPRFHAYVFLKDGVRYIQINDTSGQVRVAVASGGGHYLVLPIGADSGTVSTPDAPQPFATATPSEPVYSDDSTKVSVAFDPATGEQEWAVAPASTSDCDLRSCPINHIQQSTDSSAQLAPDEASNCDLRSCPINHIQQSVDDAKTFAAPAISSECDLRSCPINHIQ
ncbi:hypothetical protein [Frateuria defendens]|uniref:hypothetical protein n=1 Tax=Frateuria defendens TaxID=2219559 RepID=UPI001293AF4A|nr:hypothetical protein [Frateuria defendens]